MNILLIYPPFCTPASPPYSLALLYSYLKKNLSSEHTLEVLDLNVLFHSLRFPLYKEYFQNVEKWSDYDKVSHEFLKESSLCYAHNHKKIIANELPEFFEELYQKIMEKKPTIIGLSVVYNSQAFYAYPLVKRLKEAGIKVIVGGPAVTHRIAKMADKYLGSEVKFLEELGCVEKDATCKDFPDFSCFDEKDYFVPKVVLPLKTSIGCYYKLCAFCTHHGNKAYREIPLDKIIDVIKQNNSKQIFFIDDMISKKRLLDLSSVLKPLQVEWMCQLRPMKDLDLKTLTTLYESGLRIVLWGVESASQRILDLMRKGTIIGEAKQVLQNSHNIGIVNSAYIMFGFPTETKEEFLQTVAFLKENSQDIDLVLTSIFGLQLGAPMYDDPEKFGIEKVHKHERTMLDEKITYRLKEGLSQEEANALRKKLHKHIESVNKYPKAMNFFREHMFFVKNRKTMPLLDRE